MMEVTPIDWLTEVSRFKTAGHIYPGWILTQPLLGIIERDQAGYYYISNEELGLYAVGVTQFEALNDFVTSLIDNYQLLQAHPGGDHDLALFFQKYQAYLQRAETAGGELRETFYILSEDLDSLPEKAGRLTEHGQVEAALRLSEELFTRAFRASPDGIGISRLTDGKIIEVNDRWTTLFGYSREEAIGRTSVDLKVYHNLADRQQFISQVRRHGFMHDFDMEARHKSGEVFQVSLSAELIIIAGEQYLLSIIRDITERKQVEAALRQSEERFAKAFRSSPDGIAISSMADGQIIDVNDQWISLFGYSREEAIGRTAGELKLWFNYGQRHEVISLMEKQGFIREVEAELYRKSGEVFYGSISSEKIVIADKLCVLSITRDITERKRAEEALKQTAADLARSNAELEQFAYVASHDLQEPLRMVVSYTQLLARRYQDKLDADAGEFIGYAVEGATRMQQLLKGLLAYSRLNTQGHPFHPLSSELVLEQALANLKMVIAETQAVITHDPLPTVMADGIQLLQLFQNLTSNALKFRSGLPPQVHISTRPQGNEWLFSVCDNGIGFEPEYAERIFVIFQRLHNRAQYPGAGIGLAICKRIVERHGGRIWVASQPGQGATFYFTLKAAPPSDP